MKKLRITIAVLAAVSALVLPASALASSGQEGYGGPNSAVAGITGGDDGPSTPSASVTPVAEAAPVAEATTAPSTDSGTLPFTGLDVGFLAVGGIVLLGMGFLLRRVTHRSTTL